MISAKRAMEQQKSNNGQTTYTGQKKENLYKKKRYNKIINE